MGSLEQANPLFEPALKFSRPGNIDQESCYPRSATCDHFSCYYLIMQHVLLGK